ncbi:hypothetical protein scyTo_0019082 [Scyliorhinus torazame]|uniref:Uncharacterized protein n=1 Tax=Scyliorhinus torazame TaxID=75743 RepID=A0A401PSB9_SCYTO|nr:hypothetical protein [Scyliorhinus torazame]
MELGLIIMYSLTTPSHKTVDNNKMWKSAVGHNVKVEVEKDGDDWETDPDFVNDISEAEQRWGAKTVEGSGRPQHVK